MQQQRIVRELPKITLMQKIPSEKHKERVCAYARVSTFQEEQEDSFERQVAYYTSYINNHKDWEMVKVYADQGLTGTRAEKRPSFMQMIQDCNDGKIDRVLVKSISRFARNTVDSLTYIRKLKENQISINFENENIDTMTPGGEILITILAGIAEQESRNMSTNIKWAYQKKFKNGEVVIYNMMGYKKGEDGNYEIVPKEAEIVKRIFREFVCGFTAGQIVDGLLRDNIPTLKQNSKWQKSTVMRMLKNIKYTGNAYLGKTYKPDVLSRKRLKNEGQAPMYYVEGSHPAIIEKELFDIVQTEIEQRKEIRSNSDTGSEQ